MLTSYVDIDGVYHFAVKYEMILNGNMYGRLSKVH